MKLSLLIPVLNYEETLPEVLKRIRDLPGGEAHEALVIFDVTSGEWQQRAEQAARELGDLFGARSIIRNRERGFGSALRAGAAASTGDLLMPVMGDLSDDLSVIPAMMHKIAAGADVVAGARYIRGGRIVGDDAKQRLSRTYSTLASVLTDVGCGDISNSFKMYRREVWHATAPRSNSFDLSAELVVKASALGYRVDQVPATWVNRQLGKSNFHFRRELMHYGRWLALAMLWKPSRWTALAGLGVPLLVSRLARRRLIKKSRVTERMDPAIGQVPTGAKGTKT